MVKEHALALDTGLCLTLACGPFELAYFASDSSIDYNKGGCLEVSPASDVGRCSDDFRILGLIPSCEVVHRNYLEDDPVEDLEDLKVMMVANLLLLGSEADYGNMNFRDRYVAKVLQGKCWDETVPIVASSPQNETEYVFSGS